jgi:hypothetical protein
MLVCSRSSSLIWESETITLNNLDAIEAQFRDLKISSAVLVLNQYFMETYTALS